METAILMLGLLLCLSFTQGMRESKGLVQDMNKWNEGTTLLRMKRDSTGEDKECKKLNDEMDKCFDEAKDKYLHYLFGDGDGKTYQPVPVGESKPDFYARKTCNHLTSAFECIKLVQTCWSQRDITALKNLLVNDWLVYEKPIPDYNFDSEKCPITRDYKQPNSGNLFVGSLCLVAVSVLSIIG